LSTSRSFLKSLKSMPNLAHKPFIFCSNNMLYHFKTNTFRNGN
jgi:hypothetical protein